MKSNLKTCFGINSSCDDGKHILFFDFDGNKKALPDIVKELKTLQLVYTLSDFYILETQNGYNAFCLDKIAFNEVLEILEHSKYIDKRFLEYCTKRKHFTLRMGGDKKLLMIITSTNNYRNKSNAHRIFFKEVMSYKLLTNRFDKKFDNQTGIDIESYSSMKHGVVLNGKHE
jgi:hypothetical protein